MEFLKTISLKDWATFSVRKRLAVIQLAIILVLMYFNLTEDERCYDQIKEKERQITELTKKNQDFAIKCGDEKIEISRYYSKKIDTIYIQNTEQISDLNDKISKQLIELNFYKNPKK